MCGITALVNAGELTLAEARKLVLEHSKLTRHRGPDWSGVFEWEDSSHAQGAVRDDLKVHSVVFSHERLAIVDPESGAQPLVNDDGTVVCAVNGEIYNHEDTRAEYPDYKFKTKSDCEAILCLAEKVGFGPEMITKLDGMFAFVLFDSKSQTVFAARDHIGIIPLYIGYRADGGVVFCSELKGLIGMCERFELFKPGHYYSSETCEMRPWYTPVWYDLAYKPEKELVLGELRKRFETAVVKRLMSDTPWGVLLSGGLDSSLVSSVAARYAKTKEASGWPRLHSFSIGLEGSPDLAAAKRVAEFLGTKHHGFTFTVQEGLDAINDVIYHVETYDPTTIRASTPMLLMARKIKAMGVKMVLSGEGADEALGGYLYFHKAPNKAEFHKETVAKLKNLHYFDCLRANKSMSAYGVEPRVPFLDRDFLDFVMTIDPEWKMCKVREGDEKRGSIEKYIMRKAFDTPENPYLPEDVLWRQKEQFSDGVGYSWIDSLRAKASEEVTDLQFKNRKNRFPNNTPATKEAYRYREIFERHFPSESARDSVPGGPSIACSTPAAIEWDEEFKRLATQVGGDNSGRAVRGVHDEAYEDVAAIVSGSAANGDEPPAKKQKK